MKHTIIEYKYQYNLYSSLEPVHRILLPALLDTLERARCHVLGLRVTVYHSGLRSVQCVSLFVRHGDHILHVLHSYEVHTMCTSDFFEGTGCGCTWATDWYKLGPKTWKCGRVHPNGWVPGHHFHMEVISHSSVLLWTCMLAHEDVQVVSGSLQSETQTCLKTHRV